MKFGYLSMKNQILFCSAALVSVMFVTLPLAADILFEQGPSNADEGQSLRSNLDVGPGTFEYTQQIADDFTPGANISIGRVTWEGFYFQTGIPAEKSTVTFTLRMYTALNDTPFLDEQVQATYEQVGSGNYGSRYYRFSADLGVPVEVPSGQQTWIAIIESDANTPIDFRWPHIDQELEGQYAYLQEGTWYIFTNDPINDFVFSLETGNQQQTKYRLTDLGTLGGRYSHGVALNDEGQVTGSSQTSDSGEHAFMWDGTTMQDLGTFGGAHSEGTAINNAGQVTGQADVFDAFWVDQAIHHAFLWDGEVMQDLGTLAPEVGVHSAGVSINDSGQVTGSSFILYQGVAAVAHALLWDGTALQDLGLGVVRTSDGIDINEAGQVTGWAETLAGEPHAFLWDGTAMQDLGTLGGTFSRGLAINSWGQVTGYAQRPGDVESHAFLSDGSTMLDLGTLGGTDSYGLAINDSGEVTGYTSRINEPQHAFLWDGTTMVDLNPESTGSQGNAINDAGQVTGYDYTGGQHAFLWDGTAMQDLNGLIDLADPLQPSVWLNNGNDINDLGEIVADGVDLLTGETHAYLASPVTDDDSTPPLIQSSVSGALGSSGWYVSSVNVDWTVTDAESSILSSTGCGATTVSTDTAGVTFTCSATSAGGTTTESVTIRRDATRPSATATPLPAPNGGGWNKSNVTVSFSATDGPAGSGIATCTADNVLDSEGLHSGVQGFCTDVAGNDSSNAVAPNIRIDKTAPTVSIITPATTASYEQDMVVNADYGCSDSLSGVATCSGAVAAGVAIDTATVGQHGFAVAATDAAGNTVSLERSYMVTAVAPFVFTAPALGTVLQPGQTVTIMWTGGSSAWTVDVSLVDVQASAVATMVATHVQNTGSISWVFPSSLPFNGPCGRSYKFYVQNSAVTKWQYGPVLTATCNDVTPPTIAPQLSGQLGSNGWYKGNVSLSWLVQDPDSTVSSTSGCAAVSVVQDTAGVTFTCGATSTGGSNTSSVTIKRDATRPTATATPLPASNSFGWNKSNVTVSFSATDGPSGSGIATCSAAIVLKTEGLHSGVQGFCTDIAGNASNAAVAPNIRIDMTAPAASITTPVNGATYSRNQVVTAGYSCSDSLSGILSCIGDVANGQLIDTSKKVKNAKLNVDTTDRAGNTKKVTVTYTVN